MMKNKFFYLICTVFIINAQPLYAESKLKDPKVKDLKVKISPQKKMEEMQPNPFFEASSLPYQAPNFNAIKESDYLPAFQKGIEQHLKEINAIANNKAAPTFDNVFVELEKSGQLLHRVQAVFDGVYQANATEGLKQIQTQIVPLLAQYSDEIYFNNLLFSRIKKLYDEKDMLDLNEEQAQLVEIYYQNFVHAGALLSTDAQGRLHAINSRLAELETSYGQHLLNATRDNALPINELRDLKGFDGAHIAQAAEDAALRGMNGFWLLPLQNTLQQPLSSQLELREVREAFFNRSALRASLSDGDDTRAIILEIAKLRAEKAALFQYPNYAAYRLSNQMVRTPERVEHFIAQLVPATLAAQKQEEGELRALLQQDFPDKQDKDITLMPWDWSYYAEKLRKKKYDLDEAQLRPYFELHHVLEDGVFYAAHRLYGLNFYRRYDLPLYHPDVMVYEVKEENGDGLGLIYFDYFKRDQKSGGAWMSNFVIQSKLLGTKPVIYNVANFSKAPDGQPQLLSFDDVVTMFHEFGHGLHGLFASQTYPSLSGTNVARDFVEFPSQFNENWAIDPEVLSHYARDYKTGKALPQDFIMKLKAMSHFNQGYSLGEILAAAQLDLAWHYLPLDSYVQDVESFEKSTLLKTGLDIKKVPPRYNSPIFLHIWSNGYAAGYYAYLWTEMLSHDAFSWFVHHGGLTRKNGQYFRDMILSKGHSEDYDKMFQNFYGAPPDIIPMLSYRGLLHNKGQ